MTMNSSRPRERPIIEWHAESYTLRDKDGRRIGDILEVNPEFIVAKSGSWFGSGRSHVHYVPRTCVADAVGSDWRLSVSSDELEALGFLLPPTGSPFTTDLWQSRDGGVIEFPSQGRMRVIRFG
jgi:hypothetical protein